MSRETKKKKVNKNLMIYAGLFIGFYFGVMLWKYVAHDNLTWLKTFIFMFSITLIYFLLRRTRWGRPDS